MSSSVLPPPDVAVGPLEDRYKWFLANLSFSSTPQDIKEFFRDFGTVNFVKIVYDLKVKRSKGYGFLYMLDAQGDAAVEKLANSSSDHRITLLGQSRVLLQRHDHSRVQPIRSIRQKGILQQTPTTQTQSTPPPLQYSSYTETQPLVLAYNGSDYPQPYKDRGRGQQQQAVPVYNAGLEPYSPPLPTYSDGYYVQEPLTNGYSQSPHQQQQEQLGYSPSGYVAPSSSVPYNYELPVQVPYAQSGQYTEGSGQYSQGVTQGSVQGPYTQGQYLQGQYYLQPSGQDPYSSQASRQDPYSSQQASGPYSQDSYSLAQYSQGHNPTPTPPPPPPPLYSRGGLYQANPSYNTEGNNSNDNMAPRQLYSSMPPPRPSRPPRRLPKQHDNDNNNNNNSQCVHGSVVNNPRPSSRPPRRLDADSFYGRGRGGRPLNNRDRRRERPY